MSNIAINILNKSETYLIETALEIPTELNIERDETSISVGLNKEYMKLITLDVGKNMVIGFERKTIIYRGDEVLSSDRFCLSTIANMGTPIYNKSQYKFPNPGEEYRIEAIISIFETDIPPQHLWMPRSEKYKVLWSETLSEISQ